MNFLCLSDYRVDVVHSKLTLRFIVIVFLPKLRLCKYFWMGKYSFFGQLQSIDEEVVLASCNFYCSVLPGIKKQLAGKKLKCGKLFEVIEQNDRLMQVLKSLVKIEIFDLLFEPLLNVLHLLLHF